MTETVQNQEGLDPAVSPGADVSVSVVVGSASAARAANGNAEWIRHHRAHLVMVPTSGVGFHVVDFVRYPIEVGQVVHAQPGQVQHFDEQSQFEAVLVVVGESVCPAGLFHPGEYNPVSDLSSTVEIVTALATDLWRQSLGPVSATELMNASAALLLRHTSRTGGHLEESRLSSSAQLVRAFRAELERAYAQTRIASHYAAQIGTSAKTLSRATGRHLGQSPKEMIDERVALEAKRLLVGTLDPIAAVGSRLGFSEATNFTKFFIRTTGVSPHDFRQSPEV